MKALFVEGDEYTQQAVRDFIHTVFQEKIPVVAVKTTEEAEVLIKDHFDDFDFILVNADVNNRALMTEFLNLISLELKGVPIVAMSTSQRYREALKHAGVTYTCCKFEIIQMLKLIKEIVK